MKKEVTNKQWEIIATTGTIPQSEPFDMSIVANIMKEVWFGFRPTFTAQQRRNRHRYLFGRFKKSGNLQRRSFKDKKRK